MTHCCTSCGTRMDGDAMRCPACAQLRPCALVLHGPACSLVIRVETPFGRAILDRLGLRCARRLAWVQFRARRDEAGCWCIAPDASATQDTVLNGRNLGAGERRIGPRDLIEIRGAEGSIRVELDPGAEA